MYMNFEIDESLSTVSEFKFKYIHKEETTETVATRIETKQQQNQNRTHKKN